jgi:uncharacterized phage-associated protein
MSRLFKFDPAKALEIVLYISTRTPIKNVYWVLKILYFADKDHLSTWGRLTCGDSYVAMQKGPVPSGTYDILKGNYPWVYAHEAKPPFEVIDKKRVVPFRDADLNQLSQSDRECLDASIAENGRLSFEQLMKKSHDSAFDAADENDFIPLESIVETLPNAELVMDYLAHQDIIR